MIHTDDRFAEVVEAEVARIEALTDAEVVVVAAPRSGSYADVVANGASAAALLSLVALVLVPWSIHPLVALLDLVLAWALARWLLDDPWFLRLATSRARREAQVGQAASAAFHEESVHGTRGRIGLLIYVSALEGSVRLVPDLGLEARIPRGRWIAATDAFSHADLDHFVAGLRAVGELLAAECPHTGASTDRLPDAPRIRP